MLLLDLWKVSALLVFGFFPCREETKRFIKTKVSKNYFNLKENK
jgi:hypothetical protein